jgi:uncharacterized protein with GYD domain
MAKYAIFFTYTSEAWARMIQSPGDRTAAVRQLTDSVGGSVECVYWMFGAQDGLAIFDVPDSVSAAAVSVAVGSTGSFKSLLENLSVVARTDLDLPGRNPACR